MYATIRYRDHAGSNKSRNEVVMFADIRAFIMGVEVSNYLIGDVAVSRNVNGTDGTCTFVLDNNYDRFIIRPENLGTPTPAYNFSQGQSPGVQLPDFGDNLFSNDIRKLDKSKFSFITSNRNDQNGTFEYDETPKKEMFEYKYPQVLEFSGINNSNTASVSKYSTGGSVAPADTQYVNTNASLGSQVKPRYDLTIGACVIHLHDEVRLFLADPNSDPLNDADRRWMPLFSGCVSTAPVSHNRMNGESSISVSCSDVRYLLRKMRLATNIQSADQKKVYVKFDDAIGMFRDMMPLAGSGNVKFENVLSTLSYREITRAILCGDSKIDIQERDTQKGHAFVPVLDLNGGSNPYQDKISGSKVHQFSSDMNMRGTGTFTLGEEVGFDRLATWESRVTAMEGWNDLVLFGVKCDWYTNADVDIIGGGTCPISFDSRQTEVNASVEQPSPFSILNGFVHYLFPGAKTDSLGIRNAIERAVVNPGSDVSWTNRLDVLTQTSDTLDYKFYVSPMGDFVFEFPMYDFQPQLFGKYMGCYTVSDSIKSDDHNDEGDGNVVTCLTVRGAFQDAKTGSNVQVNDTVSDQAYSIIVKSDFMAARYGIVPEEHSIPWLSKVWAFGTTDANGTVLDQNAMMRNTCISFGIIEFFKRIAAMSSMNYAGCYNPFLLPNRPCLNLLQRRLGLTASCSLSIPIEGAPSSTVETYYVRKADHNNKFMNIAGAPNTPFGYGSSDRLELFSTAGLDNLRTTYGIEIVDPAQSMVNDVPKDSSQQSSDSAQKGSTVNPNQNDYSMSPAIVRSAARFFKMKQTNPALYNLISKSAAKAGMDPALLYHIMEFESGGGDHIDPQGHYDKNNPSAGAQGIIQFMPKTLIGLKAHPETFAKDYPTIESQMGLLDTYLAGVVAKVGPLNSPYKAYMSIFNPSSINDDMMKPFTDSTNDWTQEHAAKISAQNGGVKSPAELMLKLGYNYVQPQGGPMTSTSNTSHGPVTTTQNYTAINPRVDLPPSSTIMASPGLNLVKLSSSPSDNTRTR